MSEFLMLASDFRILAVFDSCPMPNKEIVAMEEEFLM